MNAIICNTPYQVLGALNITVNSIEGCKRDTEIYIIADFSGAGTVYKRLKRTGIFAGAAICKKLDKGRAPSKAKVFKRVAFANSLLHEYGLDKKRVASKKYNKILTGDGNYLGIAFKHMNPDAELIMYDDGADSYSGNFLTDRLSGLYRVICRPFHLGVYSLKADKLYVNYPWLCKSTVCREIMPLPDLKTGNPAVHIAKGVFGYNECTPIKTHRFLLLGQILGEKAGYNGVPFEKLICKEYLGQFLLRKHPRQKNIADVAVDVDGVNNFWEFECILAVTDEHVIISHYSTAQFSPKLAAGKEPYIIFAYRLFLSDLGTEEVKNYDAMVSRIRGEYKNKGKIFQPRSFDEYRKVIHKIAYGDRIGKGGETD